MRTKLIEKIKGGFGYLAIRRFFRRTCGGIKIKLIFAWFDFWIGLYYDKDKNFLYFLPLPMIGIIIKKRNQCFVCKEYFEKQKGMKVDEGYICSRCLTTNA